MALNREQKAAVIAEVADVASSAYSAVVAEYRGLTVEEMTALRVEARKAGVYLRVVKNSLARRAMAETEFECLGDRLVGPLLFAFGQEDPGSAARVIKDFAKEHEKLIPVAGAISGQVLEAGDLETLAKMPTYDEAISQLMAVMKAPVEKLARTIREPHAKMVRTVAAVRDQKEAA